MILSTLALTLTLTVLKKKKKKKGRVTPLGRTRQQAPHPGFIITRPGGGRLLSEQPHTAHPSRWLFCW